VNLSSPISYSAIIVGLVYLSESLPAILIINILVTCSILLRPKHFKGDFCFYSVNMLIADVFCLCSVGVYTSLSIFVGNDLNFILHRGMSILIDIGWYPKSLFLVFISYSRCKVFYKTVLQKAQCTKYTYGFTVVKWAVYFLVTLKYWFGPDMVYVLDLDIFTWYYDGSILYGKIMTIYNTVHVTMPNYAKLLLL